jgi:hypothetical protein
MQPIPTLTTMEQPQNTTAISILFNPEGDSLAAYLAQGPNQAFTALNQMLEATREDAQKHAAGEIFSQDQLKVIRSRAFFAEAALYQFRKLRRSNEYISKATEVWATCTRLLTAILNEMTERGEVPPEGRGQGRGKILKDLQIPPYTMDEGRKLLKFSENEIKERINQLGANGPVYKQTLLRNLATSGRSKGGLKEAPPGKREDQEELFALTRLMDKMEQNPPYFNQARFEDEADFLMRTQDIAMLNNCIACWQKVLDVLDRRRRAAERDQR